MKRIFALLLSAMLLTGCTLGSLRWVPESTAPMQEETQSAPSEARQLAVYDPQGVLQSALEIYSREQGVEIRKEKPEQAALLVETQLPAADVAKNLAGQGALLPLAAGMRETENCYGLPFGSASYGYLVDDRMLKALLGEGFDQQLLKNASWKEWADFVKAVDQWIEAPRGQTVTLGGKKYRLPRKKSEQTESLTGVFSVPAENAYCGSILTPILATQYKTAEQLNAAEGEGRLTEGALKALAEVMLLETGSLTGVGGKLLPQQAMSLHTSAARQTFVQGKALFYRAPSGEAELFEEALRQKLVLIPIKFPFTKDDLGENGYSMEEILNQPVTVAGGWMSISAAATPEAEKEAQAFLLWLHTSAEGKAAAPQKEEPVQRGLPDLSTELLQKQREELQNKAWQQMEKQS